MHISLTPEMERFIDERVESGLYETAGEVVREALRLLNERDLVRDQLRADVVAGFDRLARREGRTYDRASRANQGARSRTSRQGVVEGCGGVRW